ncbi:Uncharacterised protein [Enterobacter cancerogenus]|uniref:Uncharacterized protein n=1 Tax=Enterobacter cancerogenus TaxID=69218 RepID=A0A484Z5K5_9ENTR|nr:Uncharacterised protein [Enterobacter cancerogenus]
MGQRGNKVFANPLDQPGAGILIAPGLNLIGQNRPGGIRQHELGVRRVFGKPCLQATQRSAGANANDNGIDVAVKLLKQLRCGRGAVRQRVGRIIKLVDIKRTGQFVRQTLGVILIVGRVAFIHV